MSINRREFVATAAAALTTTQALADQPKEAKPAERVELGVLLYSYSIRSRLEKDKGFADPLQFVGFCHERGAAGVQMPLGSPKEEDAAKLRQACGERKMFLEGVIRPPAEAKDMDRFESEVRAAKACGAEIFRTVMLGGRRYEVFKHADDYPRFAKRAEESLRLAEPIVRRHGVKLAVENHKDYRVDELVDLLQRLKSEHIGVCMDTGNNLALLDDPLATVKALAPWALTVHLKDIGVEESRDGFLMAEVPLGQGVFDLKEMVKVLRQANPRIRFNLEMITRDPLSIPCLADPYWATLAQVPGRDLARTLALVRSSARKQPLPRITKLEAAEQLAAEERHVKESFAFAAKTKLIS